MSNIDIARQYAKKCFEYSIFWRTNPELDEVDISHLSGYLASDKTRLAEPYASASDRIIIYNNIFKSVAGGVLFVKDPEQFRTKRLVRFPIEYKENAVEMNGLWIAGSVPRYVSLGFWAEVCDYLRNLEGHVYFSYDTSKKGLDTFYKWVPGETIYEGPVCAVEGMPGEANERIVCVSTQFLSPYIDSLLFQKAVHFLRGKDQAD